MEKENEEVWQIELTKEQLHLIADAVEFTSRFACGQIGDSFLPNQIRGLLWKKQDVNKIRLFNSLGGILKHCIHDDLEPGSHGNHGVGKMVYADNLYDIYKMIHHKIKIEEDKNIPKEDRSWNVSSSFTKFGNLNDIKINKK